MVEWEQVVEWVFRLPLWLWVAGAAVYAVGYVAGKRRESKRWRLSAHALENIGLAHDQSVRSKGREYAVLRWKTYQRLTGR